MVIHWEGLLGSANSMLSVSFLILTYNSESSISRFLDSLVSVLKTNSNTASEIIIVDNKSLDNTRAVIRKHKNFSSFQFFELSENLGYAKGINFAASHAKGELIIVINPDSVINSLSLEDIISEFSQNKKLGVAGLIIENQKGERELSAGNFFNPFTLFLYSLGMESKIGLRFSPNEKKSVDYVSGGFTVIRKEHFDKIGGFDEDYFMYVEDMDLCFRMKENGYEVFFLPVGSITHEGQGSSNREFAIINIYKGLKTFYSKNKGFLESEYAKSLLSLKAALIIFIASVFGKKEQAATYSKALKAIS